MPSVANTHSAVATKRVVGLKGVQAKIVEGAKKQLVNPAVYDARYQSMTYPGGDVDSSRGACTDVVIRALRNAGLDLQKLVHEDAAGGNYPRITTLDKNIDHRRCPNLMVYFGRHDMTLGTKLEADWKPGDIVFGKLDSGLDHTGVVSDGVGESGRPMVIHNLSVVKEEDVLGAWKIVGHYRIKE